MFATREKLFAAACRAKKGDLELQGGLRELHDWIECTFQVSVVHIVNDHIKIGPAMGRARLNVVLETDNDVVALKKDRISVRPEIATRVVSRFTEIAARYPELDANRVHLIHYCFADECLDRAAVEFLQSDAPRIVSQFQPSLWLISGFSRYMVAFLEDDLDLSQSITDGRREQIVSACFSAMKKYDEFEYLTNDSFRLTFDSKENLDRKFNGNLLHYWR